MYVHPMGSPLAPVTHRSRTLFPSILVCSSESSATPEKADHNSSSSSATKSSDPPGACQWRYGTVLPSKRNTGAKGRRALRDRSGSRSPA
jgi:hypothetical protein